jgi:hypothetical protein
MRVSDPVAVVILSVACFFGSYAGQSKWRPREPRLIDRTTGRRLNVVRGLGHVHRRLGT